MKKQYLFLIIVAGLLTFFSACTKEAHYKALIVTGQNNHNWQASNPILKQLLDQTGLFTSDIIITPVKGGDMTTFDPKFSKYDLVVLDYNGDTWTEKTNTAFLKFVRNGGGVVVYHAADNSFPEWEEYNKIIGLGGWGNRNEKSGPYVYYRGNEIVRDDTSKGIGGTHGARSEFMIKTRNFEHPITKGLPANWLHGNDELYSLLRGPAENMEILATAFSATREPGQAPGNTSGQANRRRGRDEPVLMTITYGKGRIFHTVLGHADEGGGPAMECVGFIVTFLRGAEWAASGKVTQAIPFDFPSAAGVVIRPGFKEITLEDALANIGSYDIAKSTKNFNFLRNYFRKISGDEQALLNLEKRMVTVLISNEATVDAKKLLLRELSWMGSDYSVPSIKDLLSNAELKDEAEFALARHQK
ncbi:MAG: ThuA domain-containing protein [Bacteroidales bacterium]|nr:ThuA domain-containing protein [Bacteroidales bacterium]MDP3002204.1 ThuA domain-containing protein [Bacteroidales bacterium]